MRQKTAVLLLFTAATAINLADDHQAEDDPPTFAGIDLNENGLGDFVEEKEKADQDLAEA